MNLLVIGFGNMGSAIVKALLASEDPLFESIGIVEHSSEKIGLARGLGINGFESLATAVIDKDTVVLLAVKPQDIDPVLESLKGRLKGSLLISIAAGIAVKRLYEGTDHPAIVRVMPNTPALIEAGASGWFAAPEVTKDQKAITEAMLESFGIAVEVADENHIDVVTALSGSGPAYVFYFIEAMIEGAASLGLPKEQAQRLAIQTMIGSGQLAQTALNLDELKDLRERVTSKGGTTEQALQIFEKGMFKARITEAIEAAYARAKELGS